MNGTLTEQPLAELIREMSLKSLSGTLRLEHERAQIAVYFDSGQVIFAAANLRTLRLREYLIKRGVVAENDFAGLGKNVSDLAVAAALSASEKLTQKEVDNLLAALVADVLRVALLWTKGTWEFDLRARLSDPVRVPVNTSGLLRETAQRMPMEFVSDRFRNSGEIISRAADVPLNSNFVPAESFVLSRLDVPTKLEDLVAFSGLPEPDAQRVIYGLALTGFLEREYWHTAFSAEHAGTGEQTRAASETSASGAGQAGSRWTSEKDEEADLEKFVARLSEATNYYEIMDLPTTAGANEIKDAYYALARRYHPDRFHLQFGTEIHAKLSSAFARITQAYERLTDPRARSTYDKGLERSRRLVESAPKPKETTFDAADDLKSKSGDEETDAGRAEYNFREGIGALKEGRIDAAASYLAACARLAPQEARYRAYYGRALAASESTRRLAENEIQAAVKLDPSSANFRTMLAELYFDLNFHRRAQTEVERALTLDPNSAPARALLRKLQKSRKVG